MHTDSPIVLVVDDEKSLRDFVRRNLEVRNFIVKTASNGLDALKIFNTHAIDLVILDIMMPHMDGLETTRRIRQISLVPIIILTALGEESDKVKAFDLGADDYLTKPFGTGELLGRVKAVLRRTHWTDTSAANRKVIRGDIIADLERHEITLRGKLLDLTPTEFNLLVYMMRNAGKALSHRMILKNVWGPEYGEEAEYLRVYIGKLRQKIEEDPLNPQYLFTKRSVGYCFRE